MLQKLESQFTGKGEVKGFKFQKVYENEKGYVYKVHSQESEYFGLLAVCKMVLIR